MVRLKTKGWKGSTADAQYYLSGWAGEFNELLESSVSSAARDRESVADLIRTCHLGAASQSGFFCVGIELLAGDTAIPIEEKIETVRVILGICLHWPKSRERADEEIRGLNKVADWMGNNLIWVHIQTVGKTFDIYSYRTAEPAFYFDLTETPDVAASAAALAKVRRVVMSQAKSESQRAALIAMLEIHSTRRAQFSGLMPVNVRTNVLLCGNSGVGKSWVAGAFAKCIGLGFFSTTVTSWRMRDRDRDSTLLKIFEYAEDRPLVIMIDEVEKFRGAGARGTGGSSDNSNYFRAIVDEIMMLIDCRLHGTGVSVDALRNLRDSVFVAAGAFQELYRLRLGSEVTFSEEVEALPPLTLSDIVESGWLGEEFLNRLACQCIEIRQPTVAETISHMRLIEGLCGIELTDREREKRADKIVMAFSGFRGLESYALECARVKMRREAGEFGARRLPPPGLKQQELPGQN